MNKQTYQLLELIGIAGEMPANTIKRIPGASEYKRKCMGEAKKANLIKCHRKDRLKGFRLTQSGKQYLMGVNRERFHFSLRTARRAESSRQLYSAGSACTEQQKPTC